TVSPSATTATPPAGAYRRRRASPVGPVTVMLCAVEPAARAASTVPSPPSAMGQLSTAVCGAARWIPWVRAVVTSAALRDPLNLSGAISTAGAVRGGVIGRGPLLRRSAGRRCRSPVCTILPGAGGSPPRGPRGRGRRRGGRPRRRGSRRCGRGGAGGGGGTAMPVPRVNHPARGGWVAAATTTWTVPSPAVETEVTWMSTVRPEEGG